MTATGPVVHAVFVAVKSNEEIDTACRPNASGLQTRYLDEVTCEACLRIIRKRLYQNEISDRWYPR